MKPTLLFLVCLFFISNAFSQEDGFYLYSKPSRVNKILPDDTDPDILHIATDIGYLKKSISTNVDIGINLTSQSPAIGEVYDMSVDPSGDGIAWTLDDAIAIYNGTNIDIYSYEDSGLTIGESTSPFFKLQVTYAQDGLLYVFKEDAFGYQVFNDGVFETEVTTAFIPQDIIENNDGTKTYFAGANNGLWELEKATNTWNNYTSSNSDLTNNTITSFAVDSNDNLYIGHFQGLDRLESDGTFTSCSATTPLAVFEISLSPTNDDILVRTSESSIYFNGLSIVDYDSCSWTNYQEDGTNCLDENVYTTCTYGGNGLAYVAPIVFSPIEEIGNVYEFTVPTESCSNFDINYLNAPVAVNANVVTDVAVREKSNGNLELGFTRTFDFHSIEIDPTSFDGSFPTATTITPTTDENLYNIMTDNNYFIVETNEGWLFVDENNIITAFEHNIPDYLAIASIKTTKYDSETGIINIVHKGFDASFNYRVYKTQCNTITGVCAPSEEIFTDDRDLTQNILFGVEENAATDEVIAVAVKTDASGSIKRVQDRWSRSLNDTPLSLWDEDHPLYPFFDPLVFLVIAALDDDGAAFVPDENTLQTRIEDPITGEPIITDSTIDNNDDGNPDTIANIGSTVISDGLSDRLVSHLVTKYNDPIAGFFIIVFNSILLVDVAGRSNLEDTTIPGTAITNGLPDDLIVRKAEMKQYSLNEALVFYFTNYGLIVKTGVDISNLTLSDNELKESANSIVVFPNPTNSSFSIDGIQSIDTLDLFDVNGRLVKSFNKSQSEYNIEGLSKGIYFVKIDSNGYTITKKLIIQ